MWSDLWIYSVHNSFLLILLRPLNYGQICRFIPSTNLSYFYSIHKTFLHLFRPQNQTYLHLFHPHTPFPNLLHPKKSILKHHYGLQLNSLTTFVLLTMETKTKTVLKTKLKRKDFINEINNMKPIDQKPDTPSTCQRVSFFHT